MKTKPSSFFDLICLFSVLTRKGVGSNIAISTLKRGKDGKKERKKEKKRKKERERKREREKKKMVTESAAAATEFW